MFPRAIKVTIICDPDTEKDIEKAFGNSGIEFTREELEEPTKAYLFYIPDALWSLSVALHILEAKKDVIQGNIELVDGKKFALDDKGRAQLREILVEAMSRERKEPTPTEIPWWSPFIPEIKIFLRELISIMKWYPKASAEGKRIVTKNFLYLIIGILVGLWVLTYFGKISGDAFVFVIGTLIGYIFSFLQRFLGIFRD
jgi:hypothetical protein